MLLISDISSTPAKFNAAAIKIADFGFMEPVDTTVAIAFGASVHPFTNMTPSTRITVISKAGLSRHRPRKPHKSFNSAVIASNFIQSFLPCRRLQEYGNADGEPIASRLFRSC